MMPKVSRDVIELGLMQSREPAFKDRIMQKLGDDNPLIADAYEAHLEQVKQKYGMDAMCEVGQFLLLTYALFDAQAEVDDLES